MRGIFAAALMIGSLGFAMPAAAGDAGRHGRVPTAHLAADGVQAAEFSAQQRRVRRRAATRLRVTPLRRAYRQCTDWYAVEHRLSGTVITPQMRCWWVGG
jgi:hypothetical protein